MSARRARAVGVAGAGSCCGPAEGASPPRRACASDCHAWLARPAPFAIRCWNAATAPSYSSWNFVARCAFTASWLTWACESEEINRSVVLTVMASLATGGRRPTTTTGTPVDSDESPVTIFAGRMEPGPQAARRRSGGWSMPRVIPPVQSHVDAFFWQGVAHDRLLVQRCAGCQRLLHPPQPMCPHCASLERVIEEAPSRAAPVYSWLLSHHPSGVDPDADRRPGRVDRRRRAAAHRLQPAGHLSRRRGHRDRGRALLRGRGRRRPAPVPAGVGMSERSERIISTVAERSEALPRRERSEHR